MMSSTPEKTKAPNFARRIKWLGIGTAFVFALYSAGWFYIASIGQVRLGETLNNLTKIGTIVDCDQSEIKGFPFRFGLFCDAVSFSQPDKGIALKAGALRSAAQVYDPKHAIIELDGPSEIAVPSFKPITLNWSLLRASARVAQPLPKRVSLEAKLLVVGTSSITKIMGADYAAVHMRQEEKDMAFAGEGANIAIDPAVTPGRIIPEFSASFDLLLNDGAAVIANKPKSMRNISGSVRQSLVIFNDGGTIKLSGPLKIDIDGLVEADLSLIFIDPAPLAIALSKAAPEAANMITTALTSASLATSAEKESKIEITIRKSKIAIGFIPIGQIPPLQ